MKNHHRFTTYIQQKTLWQQPVYLLLRNSNQRLQIPFVNKRGGGGEGIPSKCPKNHHITPSNKPAYTSKAHG